MKFRYKKMGPGIVRPVIPVEIIVREAVIRYEVLVDSGADCNILPAEIGDLLGLDVPAGVENPVGGITGGGRSFFVHPLPIRVGGWS